MYKFFVLIFIAAYSTVSLAERCQPLLAPKLDDWTGVYPTFAQNGFEFLKQPISVSQQEAQTLVNDIRSYFIERNLPITHQNLPVLEHDRFVPGNDEFTFSPRLYNFLHNTKHPVFKKIYAQVNEVLKNPKEYLERGIPCEKIHVALRVGFTEAPLYEGLKENPEIVYHQDKLYTRILAPLLGTPTEVYCPILNKRMDLPLGQGTLITGKMLSVKKATWHRAQGIFPEDRVLLVITCTEMTELERLRYF